MRPSGPPGWPRRDLSTQKVLREMADSGDWGRYHGPHCPALAGMLADYHSIEHVLLCGSGTAAIELALRGAGVSSGDEVIMAAYDFKSNFQNVLQLGATPVLVDLNPDTWQLDVGQIADAVTPKTRAVLFSHLHGGVVTAPQLRDLAAARNIALVEDASQNPGAWLYGRRAGAWGDVGVLSFGGSKLMTAGRGGAVLTSKLEIAERIKRHVLRGNDAYPLSEIQAALLLPQLQQLNDHNDRRLAAAIRIIDAVKPFGLRALQSPTHDIVPVYYRIGFQYRRAEFGGLSREKLVQALRAEGIALDAGFRGNHLIHATRRFRVSGELPEATRADTEMVTLYHPVLLEDSTAIDQVIAAFEKTHRFADEIALSAIET